MRKRDNGLDHIPCIPCTGIISTAGQSALEWTQKHVHGSQSPGNESQNIVNESQNPADESQKITAYIERNEGGQEGAVLTLRPPSTFNKNANSFDNQATFPDLDFVITGL